MSPAPRAKRLRLAEALFDRFTRSTHFHPDFKLSRTARYVSWKAVLWTAASVAILYYLLVMVANIGIYRKNAETGFTQAMERVFPYPAAVAGGEVIPLSRFRKEVEARVTYSKRHQLDASRQDIEALVINQLIDKALYRQAIGERHIAVSQKDLADSMENIYGQIGGQDKLVAFIRDNYGSSVSLADFRQWVSDSLVESAIQNQVLERAEVQHILVAVPESATDAQVETARKRALDVKGKIADASQFGALAKQYSEDVSSREKDGSLGTTVRGDDEPVISADFQNAIFSQPVGQVSDPVRSKFGWHLILVTSREGSVQESMKQFTADLRTNHTPRAFIGS